MGERSLDMIGFRTGRLVVEAETEPYVNPSGGSVAQWLCRCDCGNTVVKRGNALRTGRAISCGCARSSSNMGRGLVDLSGQRFGRWTVVDRAEIGKHRTTMWNCVCDCGVRRSVASATLQNGDSRSCGCLKLEMLSVERDLVGETFGRWVVVAVGTEPKTWSCRCSCGTERDVSENSLVRGVSTSCGCQRKENAAAAWNAKADDLRGRRFGMWTAIERFDVRRYSGGGQTIRWLCRCDCGVEQPVLVGALRDGTSQSCGCATGSRMEGHVRQFCLEHGLAYTPQRSFPDLRGSSGRPLSFDFEIMTPAGPVLVECQGEQHFRAVEWFGGEEKFADQVKNDEAKRAYVASRRMTLIEIDYSVMTYDQIGGVLTVELDRFWVDAGLRQPWSKGDGDAEGA